MTDPSAPDVVADPLPGIEVTDAAAPSAQSIAAPLEALLLMATEPVPTAELAQAVRAPVTVVEEALADLAWFYDETSRGFELREVGGGWRYWTRAEHAELIGGWLVEGQQSRLSQAALETLAVIAYLQPISRGRVSAVRGVNVDGVLRTLVTRDLVQEVDRDAETGAMLFGTTGHFLERLGLAGLDDLPPIAPLLPDASVLEAELRAASAASSVESSSVELVETPDDVVSTSSTSESFETPDDAVSTSSTSDSSTGDSSIDDVSEQEGIR
ncbi:MAG: SMC-Scp complex subunit ScpB [Micropruina sp.]|uniref:SMC-Scp complex subunit ScpB n=1 Tax=Micropruina sp. TaxID=2737536 RepID=UPI0039E5380F